MFFEKPTTLFLEHQGKKKMLVLVSINDDSRLMGTSMRGFSCFFDGVEMHRDSVLKKV